MKMTALLLEPKLLALGEKSSECITESLGRKSKDCMGISGKL